MVLIRARRIPVIEHNVERHFRKIIRDLERAELDFDLLDLILQGAALRILAFRTMSLMENGTPEHVIIQVCMIEALRMDSKVLERQVGYRDRIAVRKLAILLGLGELSKQLLGGRVVGKRLEIDRDRRRWNKLVLAE